MKELKAKSQRNLASQFLLDEHLYLGSYVSVTVRYDEMAVVVGLAVKLGVCGPETALKL